MADGLYIALSGAVAQEMALDNTAQNLANATSPGYQRSRAVFSEVLAGQTGRARYTQVSEALDTTPGAVTHTDRALDAALPEGRYLAVSTDRGERYVRAVHLDMDETGTLKAGNASVVGENGTPIVLSRAGGQASLAPDGSVLQDGAVVGRLRIVGFGNAGALSHEGASLLAATPGSGAPRVESANIEVGAIEQSNAQTITAMNELVNATRSFDAFQRALDAFRDADRKVVTTVPGA